MKLHSLGYLFKEGIKGLWKNRTMSIASIGVLISCLLLTGIAAVLSLNISAIMYSAESDNSVMVSLNTSMSRLSTIKFAEEFKNIDNIDSYEFLPKEDGLESVKGMLDDEGKLLQGLEGTDNFLPDAYVVTLKDISRYDETIEQIKSLDGVYKVSDSYRETAQKLSRLERLIRYASIGIVLILGVVSLFIISNTIKVTMFSRRMEISIMKSVGATNGFVRIPFIVEGVMIGILSGALAATLLVLAYHQISSIIGTIASFITVLNLDPYRELIYVAYILIGMLFGLLGGGISIGKYLRKQGENSVAS
ncbi:permease-like cell division protein FtsX [Scatolibacter rhodanostii]|uniref:permease-like cell division protein FtsX n=1 Tax=Scatolibacter rhodanostii TaxID=2014781 RepID=UPI000C08708C|nr:permease-like cell division protein FtsX [Scatolibacter rhodanostii]